MEYWLISELNNLKIDFDDVDLENFREFENTIKTWYNNNLYPYFMPLQLQINRSPGSGFGHTIQQANKSVKNSYKIDKAEFFLLDLSLYKELWSGTFTLKGYPKQCKYYNDFIPYRLICKKYNINILTV
jgi:hypothetical protein